jgi:antitoxin component YwqK of YwqJK toxin-antitoxin module
MRFKIITICFILSGLTGYSQLLEAPNLKFEKAYGKNDSNGKKTGLWSFYRKDKSVSSKSFWKNGKREGATKRYWENGNIYVSVNYVDGKISGQKIFYYKDGTVADITNYTNGLKNGESKSYFNDGTIYEIENYKEDVLHGIYIDYTNGKIDIQGNYKNGKKHGKWVDYYEGFLLSETEYQNGNMHGLRKIRFIYPDELKDKVEYEYQMMSGKLVNPIKIYNYTDEYSENTSTDPDEDFYEIKKYYWLGNLDNSLFNPKYSSDFKKIGKWNMYDEKGNLIESKTYSNAGDKVAHRIFNKKGIVIEFKEDYKNGNSYKRNEYYDNGALESVRIIDPTDEYRTIMSKNYYEDGNTKSYYENNIRTYYYKSGKIKAKKEFNYGKGKDSQISSTTEFYENGNIKVVKKYTGLNDQGSGIKDGAWKYYNEKGELIKTENYSNGIKQ